MTTTGRSNFVAGIRTVILMAALGGLLVVIGYAIGGIKIASVFLVIALIMNGVAYWFSDKIAIASARAKPVSESEAPQLYQMVRDLTTRAGLPMPRLYVIPSDQPNAFATGRNAKHAAVAVTAGITKPLYIVKPFSGGGIASLFSTHPPIEERVRRLRQMRPSLG